MPDWHIITCEYPPQIGGVSDYTALICESLRDAGDSVHVWAPACAGTGDDPGYIHRVLGDFSPASLEAAGRMLDSYSSPRNLMLQWVPHGYGQRSMNIAFCRWIEQRVHVHGDSLQLMVHEPAHAFAGLRQSLVSLVHRWMLWKLLHAAERVWISIPAWEPFLRHLAPRGLKFQWLPIPSSVTDRHDRSAAAAVRANLGEPALLLAHFGTYSPLIWSTLEPIVVSLLKENPSLQFLLIGSGGEERRSLVVASAPELGSRLHATGRISPERLSATLSACELLIQPYPDGASSRRTSLMACISHAIPVLSTFGRLSEPLWKESNAIAIADSNDAPALIATARRLIHSLEERKRLGAAGFELYRERFDLKHTIAKLRGAVVSEPTRSASDPDRLSASITPIRSSSV